MAERLLPHPRWAEALRLLRRGCRRSCMRGCGERLEELLGQALEAPPEVRAVFASQLVALLHGFARAALEDAYGRECWPAAADLAEALEALEEIARALTGPQGGG